MSETPIQDEQVAAYLGDHPDFFETRPDLLASMRFAPAHGNRAISLHERQLEVLRDKLRLIERRFADLVHTGKENDAIGERLQRWTRELLLAESPERVPGIVVDGMRSGFSVPLVALRLWREDRCAVARVGPRHASRVDRSGRCHADSVLRSAGRSALCRLAA